MKLDEVLSAKAGHAGVRWAVTGKNSRQKIRAMISSLLTGGYQPGRLRLTRVKYKPGKKLSAYYLVPLQISGSGLSIYPIAISWKPVVAILDTGVKGQEMEAEIKARQLSRPFKRLWQVLPDQNAHLTVWPYDPAFTQLPRLSDPEYIRGLEGLDHIHREGDRWQVVPIRYRPGERHVLLYEAKHFSRHGRDRVYAKLYRDPAAAGRAARVATRVVDWLSGQTSMVSGVRPIHWSEEDGFVLYPHAPGIPMSHLLRELTPGLLGMLGKVGSTLRALHEAPPELGDELEERNIALEIRLVARACEHIQKLLPETGKVIDELLERTALLSERLPAEASTFTHSDFKADHILISPLGMKIIDFDTCARADPAIDLGKFLADLEWWFFIRGWEGLDPAQSAFLAGYGTNVPPERLIRAQLYRSLVLIKITARRAKLSDAEWPAQVNQMIGKAREVLRNLAIDMGEPVI